MAWIVGGAQRPHERAYLAELEAQAAAASIADRVRFLGQRADVPQLLAAADVHCQPNISPEPLGLAFIEALNAGLPVVSTRMGGAAEIVTERCGVLVDPGDATALADVLRRLIADPLERARLGEAGPARAAVLSDPARVLRRLSGLRSDLAIIDGVGSISSR
jgi:glycosyltransferase involved in cell wall biosynthesis